MKMLVFLVLMCFLKINCSAIIGTEDFIEKYGSNLCVAGTVEYSDYGTIGLEIDEKENLKYLKVEEKIERPVLSILNELASFNQIKAEFVVNSEDGPPHEKKYTLTLKLGEEFYTDSEKSVKNAKRKLAQTALENTKYNHPVYEQKDKTVTPTVLLNNICGKLGFSVEYNVIKKGKQVRFKDPKRSIKNNTEILYNNTAKIPIEDAQDQGPFLVEVKVAENKYVGHGNNLQDARHSAANIALDALKNNAIDSACNKDETGPSHKKEFTMECRVGDFVTEGTGNSKKEAKIKAAERMMENVSFMPAVERGKEILKRLKKKSKKKKQSFIRKNQEGGTFMNQVLNYASVFKNTEKSQNQQPKKSGKKNTKINPKESNKNQKSISKQEELLKLSNEYGLKMQYFHLPKKGQNHFTLLSLELETPFLCLGEGFSKHGSREKVSSLALNIIFKTGFLLQEKDIKDEGQCLMQEKEQINVILEQVKTKTR